MSSTSDVLTKPVVVASEVLHKAEGQAADRGQEERVQLVARESADGDVGPKRLVDWGGQGHRKDALSKVLGCRLSVLLFES